MLTLNNKFLSFIVSPGADLKGAVEIKVPGAYSGRMPILGTDLNGRMLSSIRVISKKFIAGDMISSISVIDRDGVLPAEDRELYPDYPIIRTTTEDEANAGTFIPSGGFLLDRGASAVFLPGGVVLKICLKKGADVQENDFLVTVGWFLEE